MNYKRRKPRRQVRCALCTPRAGNGFKTRKRRPRALLIERSLRRMGHDAT